MIHRRRLLLHPPPRPRPSMIVLRPPPPRWRKSGRRTYRSWSRRLRQIRHPCKVVWRGCRGGRHSISRCNSWARATAHRSTSSSASTGSPSPMRCSNASSMAGHGIRWLRATTRTAMPPSRAGRAYPLRCRPRISGRAPSGLFTNCLNNNQLFNLPLTLGGCGGKMVVRIF